MKVTNILSRYSDLKDQSTHISTLTNQHSYKVSQFHKMLKNTYGKSLSQLQVENLKDINCVKKILLTVYFLFYLFLEHVLEWQ